MRSLHDPIPESPIPAGYQVRAVAETGVDLISSGAITHSAKALDISLEIEG